VPPSGDDERSERGCSLAHRSADRRRPSPFERACRKSNHPRILLPPARERFVRCLPRMEGSLATRPSRSLCATERIAVATRRTVARLSRLGSSTSNPDAWTRWSSHPMALPG
jgi:hypothetical protein